MERLMDVAALQLGIDRVELLRKNLIPREAFPYKTPTGNEYDSGDPAGLLDDPRAMLARMNSLLEKLLAK